MEQQDLAVQRSGCILVHMRMLFFAVFGVWLPVLFMSFSARAEILRYTVMHRDNEVGQLQIERTVSKDETRYRFESNVALTMIMKIRVYDMMDVTFHGNLLTRAYLYRTLNDKVKVRNLALWDGTRYKLSDRDNEIKTITHPIYFTTASLYYVEPLQIRNLYSEKFQKMIPVTPDGASRYRLDLPNGNRVFYSYRNGRCSLVEAQTEWADIRFVLKERL